MEQEDQKCCLGSDTCPELGTVFSRVRPVGVRAGGQWPPPPLVSVESSSPARCKVPWHSVRAAAALAACMLAGDVLEARLSRRLAGFAPSSALLSAPQPPP